MVAPYLEELCRRAAELQAWIDQQWPQVVTVKLHLGDTGEDCNLNLYKGDGDPRRYDFRDPRPVVWHIEHGPWKQLRDDTRLLLGRPEHPDRGPWQIAISVWDGATPMLPITGFRYSARIGDTVTLEDVQKTRVDRAVGAHVLGWSPR